MKKNGIGVFECSRIPLMANAGGGSASTQLTGAAINPDHGASTHPASHWVYPCGPQNIREQVAFHPRYGFNVRAPANARTKPSNPLGSRIYPLAAQNVNAAPATAAITMPMRIALMRRLNRNCKY